MALMDDIKKSLQSGFQLPQFGQSERIREMQRATSGKLAGETGPSATSLAEQVAASAAEQQRQEDMLQGKLQAEQLTMEQQQQEEEARQKSVQLDEQLINARQDMQNKAQNILQDYTQRAGEIDMREDSARTQYALALMRLSNDDYLDQLEIEGARSRLQDEANFEWTLTQSIFTAEIDLLKNDLEFRSAIAAEDRAFKEYMAEWTLEQAMELALTDIDAAQRMAQLEAYGQLTTGTVRAGALGVESYLSDETTTEAGGGGTQTGLGESSTRPGSRMTYGG